MSDLKDLIDTIDGLGDHIKEDSLKYIKRISPVDEGTYRDSHFIDEKGIYSSDDKEKVLALERGHSNQAPHGVYKLAAARVHDIVEEYIRKNT